MMLLACYRNMIRKCFNEERQTKTRKLTDLLSVFFTRFSFCVIFIIEDYTVLRKKWAALKRAGCWVALK